MIEYGPAIPMITHVDGKAFAPKGGVETKANTGTGVGAQAEVAEVEADVPRPEELPEGTELSSWLVVPEETLTPEVRRAAELALEAARLFMPGLPDGVQIRFIAPFDGSVAAIYESITGSPPPVFVNAKGTLGSFFGARHPHTLWVSVAETPTTVARAVLHEAAHAQRQAKGIPPGWTRDDGEQEADTITAGLLPVVEAAAVEEGGLGTRAPARAWWVSK